MKPDLAWENLLPAHLKRLAYKAGAELAWKRSDAIEVLKFLSDNGYILLGIDIWLATQPGPTIPQPFVYDWSLETTSSANRQQVTAIDFVREFEWDPADKSHREREPYFNITAIRKDS
ncbi:MAG TPA: hypothetical protein VL462_00025 [Candidatus Nitrosotalea sp.]|jgi:hypothetical protein|nr:hypothetical protein [Candidatus Nitrosotalea sp.]